MEKKYYTYIHKTPDGEVFYVGKGTGRRAFSNGHRSPEWNAIVQKHKGLTILKVNEFSTEEEAYVDEVKLIAHYKERGAKLVNLTDGGKGFLGIFVSEETRTKRALALTGYKHKTTECPHCGAVGAVAQLKRWHFDNCTGQRPFKARVTIDGVRKFLGVYATQEEATIAENKALEEAGVARPISTAPKLSIDEASELCELICNTGISLREASRISGLSYKTVMNVYNGKQTKFRNEVAA